LLLSLYQRCALGIAGCSSRTALALLIPITNTNHRETDIRPSARLKSHGPWREELHRFFGVDLTLIPSIGVLSGITLMCRARRPGRDEPFRNNEICAFVALAILWATLSGESAVRQACSFLVHKLRGGTGLPPRLLPSG
jgi:hypothetical protein